MKARAARPEAKPSTRGRQAEAYGTRSLRASHPSRAKSEYDLPEEFNQQGNRFVENAVRRMQTKFGDRLESAFAAEPDGTFYGNVHVRER